MKIFRCDQIKAIDDYTIEHEPIASIDLMERAAGKVFCWIQKRYLKSERMVIFAGPGNNGGDGLAVARILALEGYDVVVNYIEFTEKRSRDQERNSSRLTTETDVALNHIRKPNEIPDIYSEDIIIDAIFGSGLTRPVDGLAGDVIKKINSVNAVVISIDIPSGLFGEDNFTNNHEFIIKASFTLSFQLPKLSFMFAENGIYTGDIVILQIGLNKDTIDKTDTPFLLLEKSDIAPLLKRRRKFDHKGIYGHGLLAGGSLGKMGAAVLGAGAALRSGLGLLTCHIPRFGNVIMQTSLPEAMVNLDKSENCITKIEDADTYNAVGIGPGLGTKSESQEALRIFLFECKKPMIIDADGLNILSKNKQWLSLLAPGTILTPHPKEFERLAGISRTGFEQLQKQIRFSSDHNCIVILKEIGRASCRERV